MSATGAAIGNLPPDRTSFVGRRCEVPEATRLLSRSRLVTLTGVGGVGKTRLGLRVAAEVRPRFPDGVWLVELGQVRDPALVGHSVVAALGLRDQSGRAPTAMLADYLGPRRLLLVLDSCEHVVDAAANLVYAVLRSCPAVRVLTTSREPLNAAGEVILPVLPLPVPEAEPLVGRQGRSPPPAMALFAERAAAVLPGFTLTAGNWPTVARICQRLEGLPLAIELAAAQLRTLPAGEILRRLGDRYRLLRDADRVPVRQRTLRACVEWSYDLCTAVERLLWARVAVFVGGFELDAAEEVCPGPELAAEDVLDLVYALVDKSVLIRDEREDVARYRLLDTIREFGREKLRESGDDPALRRRHRDWYQNLVLRADADLISPRQAEWHTRLDREQPNIRAALEFSLTEPGEAETGLRMATALHPYWTRGRLGEGRQWLDRAVARQDGPPTISRVGAAYADAMLAGFQGDLPAASMLAAKTRMLAEQVGSAQARALAVQAGANVAVFSGELDQAAAGYEQVLAVHRAERNLPRLLEALIGLSLTTGLRGDDARTIACYQEILAITEPRGEAWYRSYALYNLGFMRWRRGDRRSAVELLEESLRLRRLMDDPLGTTFCLEVLAWIAADERQPCRAAALLGAAEALSHIVGTPTATFPDLLRYHTQCEHLARRALGDRDYLAAFHGGAELSVQEAIAYALHETSE